MSTAATAKKTVFEKLLLKLETLLLLLQLKYVRVFKRELLRHLRSSHGNISRNVRPLHYSIKHGNKNAMVV